MVGLSAAAIVMVVSSILLLWITICIIHKHERRAEQLLRKIDLCGKAENLLLKVEAQYRLRGGWKQRPHVGQYLAQAGYLLDHLDSFFEDVDGIDLPSIEEIPDLQAELVNGSQAVWELFRKQTEALKLLSGLDRFTAEQKSVIDGLSSVSEQLDHSDL